jgi:hypothetical protein
MRFRCLCACVLLFVVAFPSLLFVFNYNAFLNAFGRHVFRSFRNLSFRLFSVC